MRYSPPATTALQHECPDIMRRAALRKFHVGERFPLHHFTPRSVPQAHLRNWRELKGGTRHADTRKNRCYTRRYWRNRRRQRGPSRSLVRLRLPSSLLRLSSSLPPSLPRSQELVGRLLTPNFEAASMGGFPFCGDAVTTLDYIMPAVLIAGLVVAVAITVRSYK